MARASTPTILSLERYGRIIGLDPMHLAGGDSDVRPVQGCQDIWLQYDWQDGKKVGREQIGRLLARAEEDIADLVGYWPAPVWVEDEWHPYPRPHRREAYGTGLTRRSGYTEYKPLALDYGYVLYGGQRATELIAEAEWTGLDADGDGFEEWAVFTIADVDAGLNVCEVKGFFKEYLEADKVNCRTDPSSGGADPSWEVRPLYSDLAGTTLTIRVPTWCLFRPDLHQRLDASTAIDADDADSYVDELVFYQEYNDPEVQVQFLWGDPGCQSEACAQAVQYGCFHVRDDRGSSVHPSPGTWDSATGTFAAAAWSQCVEPSSLRLWYKAGPVPKRLSTWTCDPLADVWAELIAILATARLSLPLCTCTEADPRVDYWREDLARVDSAASYQVMSDPCPLGTRRGEVEVWKRINRMPGRRRGRGFHE